MPSALKARQNKATVPARAISNKALIALAKPRNKYNAKKTLCGAGHKHDSMKEAYRCEELRMMVRAGQITDLLVHPRFHLEVNGQIVCDYVGDFAYHERSGGPYIVEDVKGHKTDVYNLKKKLMRACLGITIRET